MKSLFFLFSCFFECELHAKGQPSQGLFPFFIRLKQRMVRRIIHAKHTINKIPSMISCVFIILEQISYRINSKCNKPC